MMNWNNDIDCCNWDGVTCDHITGDVIALDLSCGMLRGTINPSTTIFHLPRLQRLNLAFNNFTSSILPREIGRLSNSLTHLNISYCRFSGKVPTDITLLSKLVSLDLSRNDFDHFMLGPHVSDNLLRNYTNLEEISLSDVNIASVLPNYLNLSSSLKLLDLGSTGLYGKLPHYIFNHQSLEKLWLSYNSFTGQIPAEISLLPKLVSLELSSNGNLFMQPHIFIRLLKNSTLLRELSLAFVHIGSVLPTHLNFSHLESLELEDTSLQGKLPDYILNHKYLKYVDLSDNYNLTGPIPKVNGSSGFPLEFLSMSVINLSGEIPDSIRHLKSLVYLYLPQCGLVGSLPKSLVNLRHLNYLDLSDNMLSGSLPSLWFSLPSIDRINLSNNKFDGQIDVLDQGPIQQTSRQLTRLDLSFNNLRGDCDLGTLLTSLPNLDSLDLSYNDLSGTINNPNHYVNPDFKYLSLVSCKLKMFPGFLRAMRNLRRLDLSSNEIHGHIPIWAGEIGGNELDYLNLSHNFITGFPQFQWYGLIELYLQSNLIHEPFPPSICNMSILQSLDISKNSFGGVIPPCAGLIGLEYLNLQSNLFHGPFPPSICNMSNLYSLDISKNSFGGVIPPCAGNTSSYLVNLNLGNNRFHGTIPNVYEDCGQLQGLILNDNQLEGEVPSSLSKCQFLKVLDLGNNHLNGTFPGWLGDLPNLQVLVLKSNSFHGPIVTSSSTVEFSFPSLRVLDLSHNGLVGQLPQKYFKNFNAMKNVTKSTKPVYLIIGSEYYSTTVVLKGVEENFLQISVDYMIIDLSNNRFEGEIPSMLGSLNSLIVLNLSHNNLTGRIPHALGKLSEIESLDLSCNQLIGEIPQSLADLTFLEVLNLSQNHLMGRIPQGKQFNTFEGNSFGGNPRLCGLPLQKKCIHEPQVEGDGDGDDDDEESGFTWKVVMLGYGCGTLLGLFVGYLMLSIGKPKWFIEIYDAVEHMILKRRNKRRYIFIGK